jgi:hypothetical protein
MTAIAIWCNHEVPDNPGLWIAADSRVSTSCGPALINDAAKVFALPIVCRSPGENGLMTEVYYDHTYGYCFAGDTLLGQNAYLALVPLLSNLVSSTSYIPSLAEVAGYVHAWLRRTFDSCRESRGDRSLFEVALFGHCRTTDSLSAFHFMPKLVNGVFEMTCEPHENMQEKQFLYLGDQKEHMHSQIAEALAVDPDALAAFTAASAGRPLSRIPRYVIQDHINHESFPTIGGDLQLGIADKFGFRGFALCKPGRTGQAIISYLGRELAPDLQYVGGALVGSQAMV